MSRRVGQAREVLWAVAFFAAVTLLMTWPQALHLGDGLTDLWDAKLVIRILHWDYRQTLRDPGHLFHLNFFHPAKYVLAFSENLWGASLFGFPLLAAGVSPLVNYNALFLLAMFLSAVSAWALAREITGDALASLTAGVVYAFVPWRLSQLPHFQFQWGAFLCMLFLFLLRYLQGGGRRDLALFGVFFGWNALANVHYALFSGFLVAVALGAHAVWGGSDSVRRIRGALVAAALGALAFVPFAVAYHRAASLYGLQRFIGEMVAFSGRWTDFLSAGEKNRLYGALTAKWRAPEGDFFPGLVPLVLAGVAFVRLRGPVAPSPGRERRLSRARLRAARAVDVVAAALAVVWLLALAGRGIRIGPLRAGDPGRVQVLLTIAVIVRLALAFPRRSRFASLADFLRRRAMDRRALLLLGIAAVGVLVALGGHTPYYRFLFQSFGAIFRAIRSPARGIVLFHIALGVLAALGLSRLTAGLSRRLRIAVAAVALVTIGVEYRAFPLDVHAVDARPRAVDNWLATLALPGAVIEWPFAPIDVEYVFRQTTHEQALINGYSGFFPEPYRRLEATLAARPIPAGVWDQMAALDASVLVYHLHDVAPESRGAYQLAARGGVREGRIVLLGGFAHGEEEDLVFRVAGAPSWAARLPAGAAESGRREWDRLMATPDEDLVYPLVSIDVPDEVAAGQWRWGYAVPRSGVAQIRIGSELGPAGAGVLGLPRPDLPRYFPGHPDAARAGFGFLIPKIPPGRHTLIVTVVAKDGATTVLRKPIVVR